MPDTEARESFPLILKSYMDQFGMNQTDIAKRLNISKQTVSDWMNGKKFPRVDKMQQLADIFGVLLSDMYTPSQQKLIMKEGSSGQIYKLSEDEKRLIDLYRGAEKPARKIAMQTLENNQKKNTLSKAE